MKHLVRAFPIILVSSFAIAQNQGGSLSGLVTDASGAALRHAHVIVRNTATNKISQADTVDDGQYTVPLLQAGTYEVTASYDGFEREVHTGVVLAVDQQGRSDFSLKVGSATQTVEVTAAAPLTSTESSEVGTVIDNRKVVGLPLNNRQFYSLALLAPGAYPPAQNSGLGYRGGFNVVGMPEVTNNFSVNGVDDSDEIANAPSFRPSIEGIQEFKLQSGTYTAEYGRRPGAQVNVVTKGGSNSFHGDLFEFIRNQAIDSVNYFTLPGVSPSFKRNQFGGTLGGPILRDKTFFFVNYEGLRLRQTVSPRTTVPTSTMLNGDFRNLGISIKNPYTGLDFKTPNVIDPSLISGLGKTLSGYYPSPTSATLGGGLPSNNYTLNDVRRETMDEISGRVDHTLTNRDSLFANYNYFNDPSYEPYNNQCGTSVLPGFGCSQGLKVIHIAVGETHTFSPTLINEFSIGGNRLHQPKYPDSAQGNYFGLLNAAYNLTSPIGLASTSVNGYGNQGTGAMVPSNRYDTTAQISDSVTFLRGKHTFKAGFLFISSTASYKNTGTGKATFSFSPTATNFTSGYGLADLLLGLPSTVTYSPNAGATHPIVNNYDWFLQDDWKITPYLTINAGLRYELNTPFSDRDNQYSTFDPTLASTTDSVVADHFRIAGRNGEGRYLTSWDLNNFAPRLGFSWQPLKNAATVVRGGFGTYFYSAVTLTTGYTYLQSQFPFAVGQTFTSTKANPVLLSNPFGTGNATSSNTAYAVAAGLPTPYVNEWSLGIQQALNKRILFEATYIGSKGTKLPLSYNLNQGPVRPFTTFANIQGIRNGGDSFYHGLLVKVEQTYGSHFTFLASYTLGKSIDDTPGLISAGDSSKALPQNSLNPRSERGLSDFDIRQRFVVSPVYTLPFGHGQRLLSSGIPALVTGGWQLSGIFTIQGGTPFTPYYASNNSGSFNLSDRPNIAGNPNSGPKTVNAWFNTAAFTAAPLGTFGTAGRNVITGPGYVDVDTAITRTFPIHEDVAFQFRAEAFNLANHPNFQNPTGNFGTTTFGKVTVASDPRQLQFAAKLLF
ncbi:TonB-dependent receptor [Granulicella sibirica]|uniref:Oar protein n=1 Tax=Granulicella sibirica TaxID=2479048 RepID=A0A4Q0T5U0_9BACT|nr:TonB-dependent receptor [Granulicella sibirica]RXH57990.1 Oar protein [Granulicella sibirica]